MQKAKNLWYKKTVYFCRRHGSCERKRKDYRKDHNGNW